LVVGYTFPNRCAAETKQLIGPVSSPLSIRTRVPDEATIPELLSQLQNTVLEAQAHFVPFEKLLEELELEPSLSHAPVFQVSFSFQKNSGRDVAGLQLEDFKFDDGVAGIDLALDVFEDSGQCRFRYSTDLFDRTTIEAFSNHFKTVLRAIVSNPNERICALPLLTEIERQQILVDWNDTEKASAGEVQCIPQLFEAQVDLTPHAAAVA